MNIARNQLPSSLRAGDRILPQGRIDLALPPVKVAYGRRDILSAWNIELENGTVRHAYEFEVFHVLRD